MMNWIIKNLCCFNTNNEKDNMYHYYELQNVDVRCPITKKIYDLFHYHDFDNLKYFEVYDLYLYVNDSSAYDFNKWKLKEYWIIELHKKLIKKSIGDVEYIDKIISKLITYFFFFNDEHNQTCINFLTFRKDLFNFDLWVNLLINPDYYRDKIILEKTTYLHFNSYIDLFKQFKYFNLEYNLFELILIGKMKLYQNINQFYWVKFFDLNAVLNFIKKLNINMITDDYLIQNFDILLKYENVDKEYIHTVLSVLNLNQNNK